MTMWTVVLRCPTPTMSAQTAHWFNKAPSRPLVEVINQQLAQQKFVHRRRIWVRRGFVSAPWTCCKLDVRASQMFFCETLRSVTMWKPAREPKYFSSAAAAAVTCLLVSGTLMVTVGHPSGGDAEESPAAATSGEVFSAYFKKLTRERRAISAPPRSSGPPLPVEHLSSADLFVAVKTTGRYHRQRLELLLDTWISRNMQQVS